MNLTKMPCIIFPAFLCKIQEFYQHQQLRPWWPYLDIWFPVLDYQRFPKSILTILQIKKVPKLFSYKYL